MNETTLRARYATFVLSSVIGTLLAIVIAVLMFANLVRSVPDPLTTPQYVARKEQLRAEPDSESLKASIRDLDLTLRNDYFRRRQFATHGSYLLLGAYRGRCRGGQGRGAAPATTAATRRSGELGGFDGSTRSTRPLGSSRPGGPVGGRRDRPAICPPHLADGRSTAVGRRQAAAGSDRGRGDRGIGWSSQSTCERIRCCSVAGRTETAIGTQPGAPQPSDPNRRIRLLWP